MPGAMTCDAPVHVWHWIKGSRRLGRACECGAVVWTEAYDVGARLGGLPDPPGTPHGSVILQTVVVSPKGSG